MNKITALLIQNIYWWSNMCHTSINEIKVTNDFTIQKTQTLDYKKFDGKENAYWDVFFVKPPTHCGKILFAQTTMQKEHLIDSIWNKYFGKSLFYNIFLCEDAIAIFTYDRKKRTLKEEIICFEDEAFLKRLPKLSREIYETTLGYFLEYCKKELQSNRRVFLYFDNYKIQLAKYEFLVWKDEKLLVKNFIKEVEYSELGDIIINPYTNKRVRFNAPKVVYDFFLFYMQEKQNFKITDDSEVVYTDDALQLFELMGITVVSIAVFLGVWVLMLYVDAKMTDTFSPIKFILETIVAFSIALTVHADLDARRK